MKKIFLSVLILSTLSLPLTSTAQELPNFPKQVLSQKDVDSIVAKDSTEEWEKFAEDAKAKMFVFVEKENYEEAASWYYVHRAARLFAEDGESLNGAIKKTMLLDIPALCDLFEQIKKEDNIGGFCKTLSKLYTVYPDNFKKYIRSAYAVSLIYDVPLAVGWPLCNTPSDPVAISQPEEVFNLFLGGNTKPYFPMEQLTVGELIWVFGVAGPLEELRSLKDNITPDGITRLTTSIKDDPKRIDTKSKKVKRYLNWDTDERPFNVQNIMEYGGSPFEKVYCAWRVANANGIPCLFFSEKLGTQGEAWLACMTKIGDWKFDVARSKEAESLFGRPLDPQTWETSTDFDIKMLAKRYIASEKGVLSKFSLRLSKMLYENDKYSKSRKFAQKAIEENPENWEAYVVNISASARAGTEQAELNTLWGKAYEAFKHYPDTRIKILNLYRKNLIQMRKTEEANNLFMSEMRAIMKEDSGLGIEIFSKEMTDMYKQAKDKTSIFHPYQNILRNSAKNQKECYLKIVKPLTNMFKNSGDLRSAQKVIKMFMSSTKDQSLKNMAKDVLDDELKSQKTNKKKGK